MKKDIEQQRKEELEDACRLEFQAPRYSPRAIYDRSEGPYYDFRDSQYYQQKKFLRGHMAPSQLERLKQKIKRKGPHNRRLYEFSPTLEERKEQVVEMVGEMNDSVSAMRVEQLLIKKSIQEMPNFYYIQSKLNDKGSERVR